MLYYTSALASILRHWPGVCRAGFGAATECEFPCSNPSVGMESEVPYENRMRGT